MEFRLTFPIQALQPPIQYRQKILLIGSCFAQEIGGLLEKYKFDVVVNPNGIVYNPISMVTALEKCLDGSDYKQEDLVESSGVWYSWEHHGSFAAIDPQECLKQINQERIRAAAQLRDAGWLIITLGSAFVYRLKPGGKVVANCHKFPAHLFDKELLQPEMLISAFDNMLNQLFYYNEKVQVIFTVSPVRYARDGMIENNHSKAILFQAVHHLVNKFDRLHYFPSYELVIDDLRDYRFFKEDLVHPNSTAVQYVWEKFIASCLDNDAKIILQKLQDILEAFQHRPLHPDSAAHRKFMQAYYERVKLLKEQNPFLKLEEELNYFKT
jgi:GSCFA family